MKERFVRTILLPIAALILSAAAGASVRADVGVSPLPASASPQLCYKNRIEIEPAAPKSWEVVRITPAGQWCNMCVPKYASHARSEGTIRIDAISDYYSGANCLQVLTPWAFAVEVGKLPAGSYTAEVYVSTRFHYSRTFTIAPGPVFLPLLPNRRGS